MAILVEEAENQRQVVSHSLRDNGDYNNEEEEIKEEKWVKHYSSFHQILLVGDGDFSFSLCLAVSFGSASNIVATSLDSYEDVIKKYKKAQSNLEMLHKLGAYLLHGVDATKMKLHSDLRMRKFDRIIYNFPHAGFNGREDDARLIKMHRNLIHGFFKNASGMLRPSGEIHVNHKTTAPFCNWNLEDLASQNSLQLIERVDFKIKDYPGYHNKRGAGSRCDDPFPLGESSTFKFIFYPTANKTSRSRRNLGSPYGNCHQLLTLSPQQPNLVACVQPSENPVMHMDCMPGYVWSPLATGSRRNECFRIFREYFKHAEDAFGEIDYNLRYLVHETLRLGCQRYNAEQPGRPLNGLIELLEELHHMSTLRSEYLRSLLLDNDHHTSYYLEGAMEPIFRKL